MDWINRRLKYLSGMLLSTSLLCGQISEPLKLHIDNPHYFSFRGKPTVLITSGEHYGAVLNLDFNYKLYLDTLHKDGLNLTRIFLGQYREIPGSFGITANTLAPVAEKFITPYERTSTPGAADGLNKFDLTRWNQAYFDRLRDFVAYAGNKGVVVEVTLFTTYYNDALWRTSPLHALNNVNQLSQVAPTEALTMRHAKLVEAESSFVRKIVTELKEFDNIYYEICNEPYVGGVAPEWQQHIAKVISETELTFQRRHLISQNIANLSATVKDPNPLVSIFNFHYSRPPLSVGMNYGLNKVVGLNETGFDGTLDAAYRIQAWDFLVAGGALYNNLDYSFAVGHEDGTFLVPGKDPGGGSPALRKQLGTLASFMRSYDFLRLKPAEGIVMDGLPEESSARVLADPGRSYAIYLHHGKVLQNYQPRYVVNTARRQVDLGLDLPAGSYTVRWWHPKTGKIEPAEPFMHAGGRKAIKTPTYSEDLALELRQR